MLLQSCFVVINKLRDALCLLLNVVCDYTAKKINELVFSLLPIFKIKNKQTSLSLTPVVKLIFFYFSLLGRLVADMGLTHSIRPLNIKIPIRKADCVLYLWENFSSRGFHRKLLCVVQSYSSYGKTKIMRISCYHPFACTFYLNIPPMVAKCSMER